MQLFANQDEVRLAILGLGYVGLPLAVEFGKKRNVMGFDINLSRINALRDLKDSTQEVSASELQAARGLHFTSDPLELKKSNVYIVTVPTPIDIHKNPDFLPLKNVSTLLGKTISKGNVVIFESTVYPGATEEVCVPIIEEISGLRYNIDFFVGYSPERINPGDKQHRLKDILKVTSGSNHETALFVDELYKSIITAGTHRASSIRVAEAAKVIENTQRDVNIALINELSIIFTKLGIDTQEVLEAAGTKWNFLPFKPGLVGGHCIGVDPYYLTHKAQSIGYHPEMILAGRRINDGMGSYVASELIKGMLHKNIQVNDANVLIMGLTFKENCPDLRNTKVTDIISELQEFNINVDVVDPLCSKEEAEKELGIKLCSKPLHGHYDAIVLAVAHDEFRVMGIEEIKSFVKENNVIYDLKYVLEKSNVDIRL